MIAYLNGFCMYIAIKCTRELKSARLKIRLPIIKYLNLRVTEMWGKL